MHARTYQPAARGAGVGTIQHCSRTLDTTVSRHVGESIRIGDDVLITVTKTTSEKALVHIVEAPRSIEIYRSEIYEKIQVESREEKA
ncbi:MAG: hypothetical protein GY949_11455 [Gammaproteobacteria bacterium]|nr:hypothetical protein [Gammaproteobacteria bacterium]